ncbi:phospholipase D-like domain-containing protein [Alkalibacillus salilacus]|uniref:Cardiolipin synthase n=1 Tax=Alkalibacillus salilacus TaxID=284582 RepID=A0ABT9VI94_9BACI|nr:phospholipase D-like domain-containing protein [Alkalibacillus salilacus]MDQ0160565.1 cardiolipin synthase [Alkalibacillus salilacus]
MWVLIAIAIIILVTLWLQTSHSSKSEPTYPVRHSDMTFFVNGHRLFQHYIEDIRNAKSWICVQFFIIKNDLFGHHILTVLQEKASSGVPVYLLIDQMGSRTIAKDKIETLKQAGVQVVYSNRVSIKHPIQSINERNHRKITVIDGHIGYLGGFNVGNQYINQGDQFSRWRDYHMRLTGEIIEDLSDQFIFDWRHNTSESITLPKTELDRGNTQMQLIASSGGTLESTFLDLINSAQETIQIGSPYFIPSKQLKALLIEKLKAGVHIDILYPHDSDHPFVKEASAPYLREMAKYGASVYLFYRGFYHAKSLIIDGKVADVGTANFDLRSLYLNEEVNMLIKDETAVKTVQGYFNRDLRAAMPLYDAWFKTPNALVFHIKKCLARVLRFYL